MAQAALADKSAPALAPVPRYRLNPSEFENTMHSGHDWVARVKHGVPLEVVLSDEFWAHVPSARPVQVGQIIRAMCVDLSYFVMLWVVDVGPNWISVDPIMVHKREARTNVGGDAAPSGFRIEWKGLTDKFVVIRESDNEAIKKGLKDRSAAYSWIAEYAKALKKA
jgi:hypothetical protein